MIEYDGLLEKGFSKKEAQQTIDIINRAKEEKSSKIKFLDSMIYWVLLIVAIIGNLVISIALIPFLLAFKKIPLYFTIVILAAMFGYLFDQLIKDIENLENKHQIIAWAFIPALAIVNTYYMTSFANHVTNTLSLPFALHSPILISITYVIAFILPYTIRNIIGVSSKY
jgi:hypothetical protein